MRGFEPFPRTELAGPNCPGPRCGVTLNYCYVKTEVLFCRPPLAKIFSGLGFLQKSLQNKLSTKTDSVDKEKLKTVMPRLRSTHNSVTCCTCMSKRSSQEKQHSSLFNEPVGRQLRV